MFNKENERFARPTETQPVASAVCTCWRCAVSRPVLLQLENLVIDLRLPPPFGSDGNSKGVGGDTVDGVRLWSSKLAAALKGVNPAPVIVNSDSQDASQPPMRIELTIEGYRAAGQGNTMPPAA